MLDNLSLFCRIAELNSLSAVSRALDMPLGTVSRRLAAFEQQLGKTLVHRSSRAMSLTDAGRELYGRVSADIASLQQTFREMSAEAGHLTGTVRMTAPVALGQAALLPLIIEFQVENPGINVELELSDARLPIVSEGIDLAIRMGPIDDTELKGRRLGTGERRLVASPDFLGRERPLRLQDLARFNCLVLNPNADRWRFETGPGRFETVRVKWQLCVSSMPALQLAALAGAGIALLPAVLADGEIASGRLQRLLPEYEPEASVVTALYPGSGEPSVATRQLLDFIAERLRRRNSTALLR